MYMCRSAGAVRTAIRRGLLFEDCRRDCIIVLSVCSSWSDTRGGAAGGAGLDEKGRAGRPAVLHLGCCVAAWLVRQGSTCLARLACACACTWGAAAAGALPVPVAIMASHLVVGQSGGCDTGALPGSTSSMSGAPAAAPNSPSTPHTHSLAGVDHARRRLSNMQWPTHRPQSRSPTLNQQHRPATAGNPPKHLSQSKRRQGMRICNASFARNAACCQPKNTAHNTPKQEPLAVGRGCPVHRTRQPRQQGIRTQNTASDHNWRCSGPTTHYHNYHP
jgi:hypothetical protein